MKIISIKLTYIFLMEKLTRVTTYLTLVAILVGAGITMYLMSSPIYGEYSSLFNNDMVSKTFSTVSSFSLYFVVILSALSFSAEYKYDLMKNLITSKYNTTQIYLSKLFTNTIFSFIYALITCIIVYFLVNNNDNNYSFSQLFIYPIIGFILLSMFWFALGSFILIATKNRIITLVICLVLFLVLPVFFQMSDFILDLNGYFNDYLVFVLQNDGIIFTKLDMNQYIIMFLYTIIIMFITTIIFKKKPVK